MLKANSAMMSNAQHGWRTAAGWTSHAIAVVAFLLAAFHLWTAGAGQFPDLIQRGLHVAGCLVLTFLLHPLAGERWRGVASRSALGLDVVLALASAAVGFYVLARYDAMTTIGYWASPLDIAIGAVLIAILIEAARRVIGWFLPALALAMLAYAVFGELIPGRFGFAGLSPTRVVEILFTTPRGIWGEVTGISATVIAVFVIFGAVLFACGGGRAFMDIALVIGGRTTGGAAKVAIVASGLFGSLSGSAAANIATTGSFTIPMMVRLGYRPQFASAVEAVASSGGQLLPPIMGAGAFVMAELLGIGYGAVAVGALLPALLFYGAVFISAHFECERLGYRPVPSEDIPPLRDVLAPTRLAPLIVPLAVLIGLMLRGFTPSFAGFWATASAVLLFAATRLWVERVRIGALRPILDALILAGRGLVTVGILIACAQIIVSLIGATGIGVKFSSLIIWAGEGSLVLSLILAMVLSILLGMGLPTTAAYLLAATVVAPALAQLGISGLSAHLFIFYFAILAGLTPPVCGAVFIAAALANTPWTGTLVATFRLALCAFVIPFLFVAHDSLLGGQLGFEPTLRIVQCTALVVALSIAMVGSFRGRLLVSERLVLLAAVGSLISPYDVAAAIGGALAALVLGRRLLANAPGSLVA